MTLPDADIEAVERATLQAVAPDQLHEQAGWLLPMDRGTVGRARSAVPLSHESVNPVVLDAIVRAYRRHGFPPAFRLPDLPAFERLHGRLADMGFVREQPTLTQWGRVSDLQAVHPGPATDLADAPDAHWMAMFLGAGLDPVDGACRARSLARATGTRYASVCDIDGTGEMLACGAASFSHGWLGVHGMRTAASQRGRGLAARLLHTMALEARRRGIERVFLQVDVHNAPALALYRRAGFQTAWPYAYWRLPARTA